MRRLLAALERDEGGWPTCIFVLSVLFLFVLLFLKSCSLRFV